ncbi:unnamed protein product [Prorocentrum cordatum]|uniref:Uncharacterized protein n=1 Tax=Prorocentrum cordatum TaxID=2364126 RepID=A0ABN9SH33_9DINO|nr:unnamed protein product [Polarella glacialis]CAK0830804.1 unnamed protein product [Polarella glacialis]
MYAQVRTNCAPAKPAMLVGVSMRGNGRSRVRKGGGEEEEKEEGGGGGDIEHEDYELVCVHLSTAARSSRPREDPVTHLWPSAARNFSSSAHCLLETTEEEEGGNASRWAEEGEEANERSTLSAAVVSSSTFAASREAMCLAQPLPSVCCRQRPHR